VPQPFAELSNNTVGNSQLYTAPWGNTGPKLAVEQRVWLSLNVLGLGLNSNGGG
jgi:hypothetical protein